MPDEVGRWLEEQSLGEYTDSFTENAVEFDLLSKLTEQDLRELGVAKLGHRKRLLDAIAELSSRNEGFRRRRRLRKRTTIFAIVVILFVAVALFNLFQEPSMRERSSRLPYSEFLNQVENGQVADVTIQGLHISGHTRDGRAFATYNPSDPELIKRLRERGVRINAVPEYVEP